MYRKFFGLEKRPFILSPDPEFLYMSKGHDLALTHLEYGVVHNVGFLALTGEVGAGKTTLLKFLFEKIKDSLDVAMLFNTNLDSKAFLEMLAGEYELEVDSNDKSSLIEALSEHFLNQYTKGRRCVIMVDEAQNLPNETFEELRMLSNLEIGSDFLLQIILVGQPQLKQRLADPALAQLAQRISVYYHLSNLSKEEVGQYIRHRLKVAGYKGPEPLFQDDAIDFIAEVSKGIPRLINSLCDACLTYAFADETKIVTRKLAEKVVQDNELLTLAADSGGPGGTEGSEAGKTDEEASVRQSSVSHDQGLLSRIYGRLEGLEMRVSALEAGEKDKLTGVLQEMLAKEREKNILLEKRIIAISYKYRELEKKLQALKASKTGQDNTAPVRTKRFWEVFSEKK